MHLRRKAAIVVAALILASQLGSPAAAEAPSLEQLATMTALLEVNDVVGLRRFFLRNPELLEGDGSFATTMRQFMEDTEDMSSYLAFQPDIRDALETVDATDLAPPAATPPPVAQPEPGPDPEPEPQPGPPVEEPAGY